MSRPRIAVIGVGAIGGVVAADLAEQARFHITLCTRTPFDRLIVEHPEGVSRQVEAVVVTKPEQVSSVDWVLLATKAHQCNAARPWLDALCGSGTTVVVLQNGVDHVERVAPLVAASTPILPVVVQLPAEKTAPGRVRQLHAGVLLVPDDESGRAFAGLFTGTRVTVKATADFLTQAWWKLAMNAALGGICALTLRENGVARDPELRNLILTIMREVAQVGRAEGAKLPENAPEKALDLVLGSAPDHWSSITVDRREERPMEWEARNEVVQRYGRKHGIATPMNDIITMLLKAADQGVRTTEVTAGKL